MINRCLLFILLTLTACQSSIEVEEYSSNKADIQAYNLIEPIELEQLLEERESDYILVQVSTKKKFEKQHLEGALNVWRPDYGSKVKEPYGGLMGNHEEIQSLLQNLGYQKGKTLLLYDLKANVDACRLAWVLSYYGFENYKIINGGFTACVAEGMREVSGKSEEAVKTNFQLKPLTHRTMSADFEEVRSSILDTNTLLIDTREDYEFLGQPFVKDGQVYSFKKGAFSRGSIPGAIHLNWSTLADLSGDHRIKAEKNLRHDLKEKGVDPEKNIILYCQSGSRTSHTYYVLKHVLDYPNVKNYDGSWIEWSYKNNVDSLVPINLLTSKDDHDRMYKTLELELKN